jgi:SAM-dependent methyltransferase
MSTYRTQRSREEWTNIYERGNLAGFAPVGASGFYDDSLNLVRVLRESLHWKSGDVILDVGCANGRVPLGLIVCEDEVKYIGIEPVGGCIDFCRSTFAEFDDLHFEHFDVANEGYNPEGTLDPINVKFPVLSGSCDIVIFSSVFSHLKPAVTIFSRLIEFCVRGGRFSPPGSQIHQMSCLKIHIEWSILARR